jgi:hypothetical protein
MRRANADDVDVELDILNLANLDTFQTDEGALPYAGGAGAILSVPFGWIIDGSRSPWGSARLYRRGRSFEEAYQEPEFMYVQFQEKDAAVSTAEELLQIQNDGILNAFPNATITTSQLDLSDSHRGFIRTVAHAYQWLEITGAIEFKSFILFVVLHCREIVEKRNKRKLEYLLRKAVPLSVRHRKVGTAPSTLSATYPPAETDC